MKRRPQVPDEGKDSELWHATRRRFLQVSALAGTLLSVDLLRPSKKVSFAIEGDLTPTDMRVKAMKVFGPPTFFM
jgi:hypothetical protein